MHHIRLRLAAGVLTFLVGMSLADYLRGAPSRHRADARRRLASVSDHPSTLLLHPLETVELPWDAFGRA
ncbi:MAG TPA: hypothetical protein VG148_07050 [Pyrinomonadaceae bacterium]|nr:hypothetical protein [Pyrinomonadaceae bacterium]